MNCFRFVNLCLFQSLVGFQLNVGVQKDSFFTFGHFGNSRGLFISQFSKFFVIRFAYFKKDEFLGFHYRPYFYPDAGLVDQAAMEAAGRIVDRMIELKGMSQDVMKNSFDNATYENEFRDLQVQIHAMSQQSFNVVSLFAQYSSETSNAEAVFNDISKDNTVSVFVSSDGSTGAKVSLNKATLLSALTINASTLAAVSFSTGATANNGVFSFAAADSSDAIALGDVSVGVFNQALENIAALRSQNGGTMSRLNFASDNITKQSANMEAAYGRIMDVDIAAESTRLAKYNVLVQSSAAMLAQANASSDVVLMLLR